MNREQAKQVLNCFEWNGMLDEARNVAIKALEQKPAIEVLQEIRQEIESKQSMDYQRNRKPYNKCLEIVDNHIKGIEHE